MELINIIGLSILAETTYLTYRSRNQRSRKTGGKILLDTSALVDGRIAAIASSGFISSRLIVPKSVVRELQYMADKSDHDKRERARFGLDMIQTLQAMEDVNVEIYDDGDTHADGVDEQLIVLAKRIGAQLCTTDYNLNKVARVESIAVVNVNELAHALRPMHLPGERLSVAIVQPGQNEDQGVGYLDDGTMVVVDKARRMIGDIVEVEAVRVLQTEAGRMLFAKRLPTSSAMSDKAQSIAQTVDKPVRKKRPWRGSKKTGEDTVIGLVEQQNTNSK